jgi:hypothetical protein
LFLIDDDDDDDDDCYFRGKLVAVGCGEVAKVESA